MNVQPDHSRRVLIVDDNLAIHEDFRKIFSQPDHVEAAEMDALADTLFDEPAAPRQVSTSFEIDTAAQGKEALALVLAAMAEGRPYAMAFVDMRMPPGWDGLATIERLWQADPTLQVVICSAYSDYSWEDLRGRFGECDGLLIIKKPFDAIEVVQCVHALTTKWRLAREARAHLDDLEAAVRARTVALETANTRLSNEMREREQVEGELRLAQRLEAIGQLAAGVAHEINTPIQYVGDSLHFVDESVTSLIGLVSEMRTAASGDGSLAGRFDELASEVDLPFLDAELPPALDRMRQGVARVATIVRSMKELAHVGPRELTPVDINRALQNVLEVTANNYRLVASVDIQLDDLPQVMGFPGDLSQVFLNLIVNAAHAMEDRAKQSGERGMLSVRTRVDGRDVVISIGDTGCGIPETIQGRIFEVFFTTKEVGRGTGQGLPISRKIIVDRHGGALTFDSSVDVGTTFHIRLPIDGPANPAPAADQAVSA
jgi:two-component system NtrC family sensor kinase